MVMRPCGHERPEFSMAHRTRCRASETAASGRPTTPTLGKPAAKLTSTEMIVPVTPTTATPRTMQGIASNTPQVFDDGATDRWDDHRNDIEPDIGGVDGVLVKPRQC